jgi:hypothetical protein
MLSQHVLAKLLLLLLAISSVHALTKTDWSKVSDKKLEECTL